MLHSVSIRTVTTYTEMRTPVLKMPYGRWVREFVTIYKITIKLGGWSWRMVLLISKFRSKQHRMLSVVVPDPFRATVFRSYLRYLYV
jgi:hypothetical protein